MIDINALERMAKERPDEAILKGSGVLKLIAEIKRLESVIEAAKSAKLTQEGVK